MARPLDEATEAGFVVGTVFSPTEILETSYNLMNQGLPVTPKLLVHLPGWKYFIKDQPDPATGVNRLTEFFAQYRVTAYDVNGHDPTDPAATVNPMFEKLDPSPTDFDIPLPMELRDLVIPPACDVRFKISACGNAVRYFKATDTQVNMYGGLCYEKNLPVVGSFKGMVQDGSLKLYEGKDVCQTCLESMSPNSSLAAVVCPAPQVVTTSLQSQVLDVKTMVQNALGQADANGNAGITVGNVYLANVYNQPKPGDPAVPCGTCSIMPFEYLKENVGMVHEIEVRQKLPDDVNNMNEFLLKYSCFPTQDSQRISFNFGTEDNLDVRYLTNYLPGTPACDTLARAYCQNAGNINQDECVCYKELNAYVAQFGRTPVAFPIRCVGGCADNPKAYHEGQWKDQECNVEVCVDFFSLNGNSVITEGSTNIICSGQAYSVSQATPITRKVEETPIRGLTKTSQYVLISLGVIFFVLLIMWLAVYIQNRINKRNSRRTGKE